jgi:hypothetical protein
MKDILHFLLLAPRPAGKENDLVDHIAAANRPSPRWTKEKGTNLAGRTLEIILTSVNRK